MTRTPRGGDREQVNISVDNEVALALRLIAARDGVSVPELLRPAVDRLVAERLEDPDLAAALAAVQASRRKETRLRPPTSLTVRELRRPDS